MSQQVETLLGEFSGKNRLFSQLSDKMGWNTAWGRSKAAKALAAKVGALWLGRFKPKIWKLSWNTCSKNMQLQASGACFFFFAVRFKKEDKRSEKKTKQSSNFEEKTDSKMLACFSPTFRVPLLK